MGNGGKMPIKVETCIPENYIEISLPHLEGKLSDSGEEYSIIRNIFIFDIGIDKCLWFDSVLQPLTAYELAKKKKSGIRIRLVDESMLGCHFYSFENLEKFAEDFKLRNLLKNINKNEGGEE